MPLTTAAAATAVLWLIKTGIADPTPPDFHIFWTAGRAVLNGADPYAAIGALRDGYPYFYPYTTALLTAPLALLPVVGAWFLFGAISAFIFALAGQHYGRGLLVGCLSGSFIFGVGAGQWTPLLVGAAVLPWAGWLLPAKPSVGLALFAWRPAWLPVVAGLLLLGLSLLMLPEWPAEWLASLRRTNHIAPVLRPGGALLLLALLRWREPEARLLVLLALIPQTTLLYETLPLWLIPRTRLGGYLLVVCSYVAVFVAGWLFPHGETREAGIAAGWPVLLICLYLPALGMVLRSKAPER